MLKISAQSQQLLAFVVNGLKIKLNLNRDYQAQVYSGQMVLVRQGDCRV